MSRSDQGDQVTRGDTSSNLLQLRFSLTGDRVRCCRAVCQLVLVLFLGVLLIPISAHTVQGERRQYRYVVSGRVIDDQGRPIPYAEVILHAPTPIASWESFVPYYKADSKGRFRIEGTAAVQTEERVLYVTTSRLPDSETPIAPPFEHLRMTYRSFAGKTILIRKDQEIDLSDVLVQVRYGTVLINLHDDKGAPLLKGSVDEKNLPHAWLRVRDQKGDVVSEGGVSRKAFRASESTIALALPEGKWKIELALEGDQMVCQDLDAGLVVHAAADPLRKEFRLPAEGWRAKAEKAVRQYSPEKARRELERMGIGYSEGAFIERAKKGNTVAVALFLAAGMAPDAKGDEARTALMAAAFGGYGEIVELLLSKGADANAKDSQGGTPLMLASAHNDTAIVRTLIASSADVNAKTDSGVTALIFAGANGHLNNVRALLAAGADVNAKDRDGKTALIWAVESGHADLAELLRKSGARD